MAKKAFDKFISREIKGARKKEMIRQEKKKVRAETKAFFEQKKQQYKQEKYGQSGPDESTPPPNKEFKPAAGVKKSGPKSKPASRHLAPQDRRSGAPKENQSPRAERKPFEPKTINVSKRGERPAGTPKLLKAAAPRPAAKNKTPAGKTPEPKKPFTAAGDLMPLNKYIAHAGICSRRDGAELVRTGKVTVNDRHITDPGFKVTDKDDIRVNGKKITAKRPQVYILLNKPKDYLTTTDDPQGRKTVLDIIKNATAERVYPVGRLDRNTTGVLLLTNDGELAQKLSHPKYMIKKIYEVKLDKPLIKKDFDTILNGVTLEDGFIAPDSLAYADAQDKSVIGIEIHSGKNRIVRRIFESLGYDVRNLDRVMYANLTKKNVERGKWRMLTDKEIRLLKFMNSSYSKKQ